MNVILLSGGSGSRLWPLSNVVRSKQFLKVFKTDDGHESMIQRMYRMIKSVDNESQILVATSEAQIPQIKYQLGDNVGISLEPDRKDTFPAIALACALLKKNGVSGDASIVVCPVDPYVNEDYFETLRIMAEKTGESNLTLMGITPGYPSTKYGYILPNGKFTEKPTEEKAKEFIEQGALWNGGVFAFQLKYLLKKAKELIGTDEYDKIFANYSKLQKISFDYAVAEKEESISVVKFDGQWEDLGTWDALTKIMQDEVSGNAVAVDCHNTHIINELSIPLIAIGAENMVVAATPDGLLVADKQKTGDLKEYIANARPMHESRPWGHYTVLEQRIHDDGKCSLTKHLIIAPGKHISYQRHKYRMEMWTFIEGEGELIVDGKERRVTRGDNVVIQAGVKHAIKANNEALHIIEVQIGEQLVEEDIERLDWNWNE